MGDETVSEKKRCVIVGGADIGDYARVKQYLREDDAVVFCDSGLKHMEALGVKPALIVGDFDSHCNPHLDVETIVLPCEKDDTDTVFAVKTMVQRGYDDFLLIGVIGARLDHTLGNVSILLYLDSLGKKAEIVDDYSEMRSSRRTKSPSRISTRFSRCSISRTVRGGLRSAMRSTRSTARRSRANTSTA